MFTIEEANQAQIMEDKKNGALRITSRTSWNPFINNQSINQKTIQHVEDDKQNKGSKAIHIQKDFPRGMFHEGYFKSTNPTTQFWERPNFIG